MKTYNLSLRVLFIELQIFTSLHFRKTNIIFYQKIWKLSHKLLWNAQFYILHALLKIIQRNNKSTRTKFKFGQQHEIGWTLSTKAYEKLSKRQQN